MDIVRACAKHSNFGIIIDRQTLIIFEIIMALVKSYLKLA